MVFDYLKECVFCLGVYNYGLHSVDILGCFLNVLLGINKIRSQVILYTASGFLFVDQIFSIHCSYLNLVFLVYHIITSFSIIPPSKSLLN